jgi:phospholipid/cholesterol/gamma-HCH transport system substrate-binding protein
MEFSARYTLAGLFVLATLLGAFGFIYWLSKPDGVGETTHYRIRFPVPVSGLSKGSDVLFNGIKIGEVSALKFDIDAPDVTIVEADLSTLAPIHVDTTVGIAFQGLTGAASILMIGGSADSGPPPPGPDGIPVMEADPTASRSWTDSANRVIGRLDNLLSDNSGHIDTILAGLERITGGGTEKGKDVFFDLPTPEFSTKGHADWQLVVAEPAILLSLNTDRIQIKSEDGSLSQMEGARWTDNLPNLFQTKLIRAFENAGYADSVMRPADVFEPEFRLAIDIRDFYLDLDGAPVAHAALMAKLLDRDGQVLGSRLFEGEQAAETGDLQGRVEAMRRLFSNLSREMVAWTLPELGNRQ